TARGRETHRPGPMSSARGTGRRGRRNMPPRSRPVFHLELHPGAVPGASAFYSELCGWRPEWIHAGGGSYLALDMGRRQGGGIVECTTERALWLADVEGAESGDATAR